MRPIHVVRLDKARPAVLMTREAAAGAMSSVTVAAITSTARGLSTEVPVGPANGLELDSVVSCDNLHTVPVADVGRLIGHLHERQEAVLAQAVVNAFDLRVEDLD